MQARRIAGNIVPAMITSTSVAGALATVELLKIIKGRGVARARNSFGNLATPFLASSRPVEPKEVGIVGGAGGNLGKDTFNVWDRIVVKPRRKKAEKGTEKGTEKRKSVSLRRLIAKVEKRVGEGAKVASITWGEFIVYMNFMVTPEDLERDVFELAEEATEGEANLKGSSFVDLAVVCESEEGEELEGDLPLVRVMREDEEKK